MNITQEADYGLRVVEYFSRINKGDMRSASNISKTQEIPIRFLQRILTKLKLAGILDSRMGSKGGYYLLKEPRDISLKDVIEAIDGEININKCLEDKDLCNRKMENCRVRMALAQVQEDLSKRLDSINFENI